MATVPGIMLIVGIIVTFVFEIENWFMFFICVIGYSIVYAGVMYRFILNNYEKDIFRRPVRAIVSLFI